MPRFAFCLLSVCLWAWLPDDGEGRKKMKKPISIFRPHDQFGDQCEKNYLLFEFSTSVPSQDICSYFDNVRTVYRFKVIGAKHYIFVVENDFKQDLTELILPDDAAISVTTFPVETLGRFFDRYGIDFGLTDLTPFVAEQQIIFVERLWRTEVTNEDLTTAMLSEQAEAVTSGLDLEGRMAFVGVASYPTKFLFFWNISDCQTASDIAFNADALGGPSTITTRVLRLFPLPEH